MARFTRSITMCWLNVWVVGNLAASWVHSIASLHFFVVWYWIFFFSTFSSLRRCSAAQASSPISARRRIRRSCALSSRSFLLLIAFCSLSVSGGAGLGGGKGPLDFLEGGSADFAPPFAAESPGAAEASGSGARVRYTTLRAKDCSRLKNGYGGGMSFIRSGRFPRYSGCSRSLSYRVTMGSLAREVPCEAEPSTISHMPGVTRVKFLRKKPWSRSDW
mmetsp:Transcript_15593/g.44377  ORF Transcript_15593/g.44377 Transcript_15593/m.44377 type:complete len:218 (+) Transcript_15593:550-1203(+)